MNPGFPGSVDDAGAMDRWQLARDPLLALQQDDAAPFEQFVATHARTLIAFFRQRGATRSRSEDLTQDVFLKLYQSASRYQAEERFNSYCFRVARNVWIDECRRSGARADRPREDGRGERLEPSAPTLDPAADLQAAEEETHLRRLLGTLPEAHRAVFELAVLGELGYAEISALLDIPVGTVKSRMFYAVRRLRQAFDAQHGTESGKRRSS